MSLFGGETSATSATSDSFSRDASPFTQSDSEPLQAVQIDGSSSVPSHKPKAEDDADDGDIELLDAPDDSGSSDYEPDRPNRFVGPPQTWRRYTVAERQLAASMEQVLAGDLAAHLYNAHVPKRELRPKSLPGLKNWHSKSRWYKENNELRKEGPRIERDPDFLPWKGWTLWPLPDAPRLRERFGVENGEDGEDGMIGGTHNASAGDDLRNVLLGTFQRFAKEQWQARPPADSDDEDTKTGMESETDTEAEANVKQESRSRSRSTTRRSRKRSIKTRSPSRSNTRAQKLDDDVVHTTEVKIQSDVETSEASEGTKKRRVRRRMRKGTYFGGGPLSRPVVLADDEKARRILQPTVNSLLSKVDKLLEVLRRSNQNHWVVRGPPDTEMESDGDTISRGTSPSRSSSRLRKPSTTQDRGPSSRPQDEFKSTKGRNPFDKPLKRNGRNPLRNLSNPASGSESDYPPGDSGDAEDEDGQEDSQPRSKRRRTNRQHDLKPRDWSEVLGLASMTGWDPAVIDRAAKRCSALFGESMDFRTLQEGDSLKAPEDPIAYTPNLTLAPQTSNPNDGGILEDSSSLAEPRPYWPPGTQSCPHTDCWGNKQQFKMPYRAIEHCIRVHKYDPRVEKREASPMLGAVHVDGFLQPIHKQHGWRGGDAGDSEKRLKHAQKRSAQKTWDVNESEYRASRRLARKRESG
ncbi:uncharacterized protein BDZ99DRAFT_409007 [Mytilinidion resinicola]|uniref:Rrn9 domain-containing protein n=1 Tax=Mytilinidion resinicola TaxID=574789 RepID=A0A6A6Z320_9PEZI|nr:uncharacterized protein BDZ99DRAFT_409007 [Mytilinidion resinicola]KAF2815218.1 hypothetical protein BDZ99DRAFT_409007 [Mytilinidion resinicola]